MKKIFFNLSILTNKNDLIIKLIGAFMLVGGLIRLEMIEKHALQRQNELVVTIEKCNQRVQECQTFEDRMNTAYIKLADLELQINAYELSMLMYMSGKIDTVQVIEALEHLAEPPKPSFTDSIIYGIE